MYRDHLATLAYAEQKGIEKGIEKGIQKGIQKGKREEAIAIAREMKKAGVPVEQIARFTKLSVEEIEKL